MDNTLTANSKEHYAKTPRLLIDETISKVTKILNKKFTDYLVFDRGSYTIARGSTQVMIIVRPFTEDDTAVEFIAQVVTDANIDEKLMKYLLRMNAELHFGAFALLFDDTITFSHTIAGKNLDENEFLTALNSVAVISDHYDDEIVAIAGGKRAKD